MRREKQLSALMRGRTPWSGAMMPEPKLLGDEALSVVDDHKDILVYDSQLVQNLDEKFC